MKWSVYNDLAWVDDILAPPEACEEEALLYIEAIKRRIPANNPTMLHLGCGAGRLDFHFKRHFWVTGVDLSEGMLDLAKTINPQIAYVKGDMRTVKLNEKFDVVIIPDAIAYMTTLEDLKATLQNASAHMKPDGIILITAHTKEDFRNNNFAYAGEKDGVHITLLENNHMVSDSTYEAAFIYLIRRDGDLSVSHEVHTLGLFPHEEWMRIFQACQLHVEEMDLDHLYSPYVLQDGWYRLKVFIGACAQ
ncbi:MAG: class I SAM-dependent DNA methyltransferase [Christensenellales bacterium]